MQDKSRLLPRAGDSQKRDTARGDLGKGYRAVGTRRERGRGSRDCGGHAGTSWSCGSNGGVTAHGTVELPHTGTFIWFSFLKRCLLPLKSWGFLFLWGKKKRKKLKHGKSVKKNSLQRTTLQTQNVYEKSPLGSRGDAGNCREEC